MMDRHFMCLLSLLLCSGFSRYITQSWWSCQEFLISVSPGMAYGGDGIFPWRSVFYEHSCLMTCADLVPPSHLMKKLNVIV